MAAAYREPQRRYHDSRHLHEVRTAVRELEGTCRDRRAVLLAAWFHDAVYDPRRQDNEARSAQWALRALVPLDATLAAEVARLVETTRDHGSARDPDARVLADADRRIWAAPPARYAEYARGIRAEYGHYLWPVYARGRSRFLQGALRAPRLFFLLDDAEERAARANLAAELRCLAAGRVLLSWLAGRDPLARLGPRPT